MIKQIIILILFSSRLLSQSITDYAYTGYEATSLCGAVVANKGDNWSLYHNPSGIIEVDHIKVSFSYSKLYNQSFFPYSNADIIIPSNKYGSFGLSIQDMTVSYQDKDISSETSIGFSHAMHLLNDMNSTLSLGYTVNVLGWDLGQSAGMSGDGSDGVQLGKTNIIGLNIGFQASLRNKYRVGVFIKNINQPSIGTELSSQPLNRRLSIGTTYYPINDLMTSLVIDRLLGQTIQVKFGMKYRLSNLVSINIGGQSNPNRLGSGIEINYENFIVQYSILTHHVLPLTHQFSFGYSLNK